MYWQILIKAALVYLNLFTHTCTCTHCQIFHLEVCVNLSSYFCRLDPIITNNPTSGAKKTSVTFARNSEVRCMVLYIVHLVYRHPISTHM